MEQSIIKRHAPKQMSWKLATQAIHGDQARKPHYHPLTPALVPAVAYSFPTFEAATAAVNGHGDQPFYGRYGNETTKAIEEKIALLERGEAAVGLSSGMAAISAVLLYCLKPGDHALITQDVYGGTYKFLQSIAERYQIQFDYVDCTRIEEVERACKENTRVLYLETPSNPCLTILDIQQLSAFAAAHQLSVIVDNTFMTPLLQQPLLLGADFVVHSATKYLNGHGDVLAGFIVGREDDIEQIRKNVMGDLGQQLNAWDAFLLLRGLKTLAVRLGQHSTSAQYIAERLEKHPVIDRVCYPGLTTHPQHELALEQMSGMGGIVSFYLRGGLQETSRFLNALQLAMISFSLGDPETLVQHPASMTHGALPYAVKERLGITDNLIRLSVGLEHVEDILGDLVQALEQIR
jgi:methionine-gamma-lyase